ncbi:hypothetical protein [Alienimonas californiensis]|uniref:Uncharacterized protein n=1 Tax=Alienimonas californiensis TaxID=2527989 RepID=A0A517PC77_9PLAN|nr:hypothetical protein [Alienimonas californiensis]QDT16987.1 hypothetical protein CA12_30970 [Alienimonas californiensis]
MARTPARRRRLLAHKSAGRPTDYPRSSPAYVPEGAEEETEAADDERAEDDSAELDSAQEEDADFGEPTAADEPGASSSLLPATVDAGERPPRRLPLAGERPRALPSIRSNPGPLPEPLPPRLDEVVRRLREDLLTLGGPAAALADEICARHRDRLREALGLSE